MTILVSGASGIVGYGILRSLKDNTKYRLIGTSVHDDSAAPLFCDIFEKAPLTNDPNYFEWLIKIIEKHSVSILIPGIECDMLEWNDRREFFENKGVFLLLNAHDLINLCRDKWVFYNKLFEKYPEITIPSCIAIEDIFFDYPLILKPRVGFGSKGIVRIKDSIELVKYRGKIGDELMIQPIIGNDNEEFTVSAFFDNNSKLIDYLPLRRKLSPNGYTQTAEVVNINFEIILNRLAEILFPVGPTNFQFRFDGTNFKLLEVNPRISSATSIRAKLGYNESIMSLKYFIENEMPDKIDRMSIINLRAIRYTEEIIIK